MITHELGVQSHSELGGTTQLVGIGYQVKLGMSNALVDPGKQI